MRIKPETCSAILLVMVCALTPGCAHLRERIGRAPVSPEEGVQRAIEALAARQAGLHNFKARARFSIESPDLERRQSFRGNLAVEMPDKLRLVSSGAFGRKLFDLISSGKSFLLYYPSEQKVFFEKEGVVVESLPFSVSPSDIVKELFLPEDWARLGLENVQVVSPGGRRMVIAVYSDGRLTRKLWIQRPRWWLVRGELYAEDGSVRALTVLDRYREIGGMWLPTYLEARYPQRETRLTMRLSNVEINGALDPSMFVFPTKLLLMADRQRRESETQ